MRLNLKTIIRLMFPALAVGLALSSCKTVEPNGSGILGGTPPEWGTPEQARLKAAYDKQEAERAAGRAVPRKYVNEDGIYSIVNSTVSWEDAVKIISEGDIDYVFQTHDRTVNIKMKDGSDFFTTEPNIDEVIRVIERAGKSDEIGIMTE